MARPINIHEQYRFFYDHPVNGETQCYPAINELVTEWVKEEGQIFYRKQISQNFIFINNAKREITDFTDLYELDRSDDNRCEKIDFRIEIKCGEDWEEWYLGYIALVDGEFDVDRCVLSVPIRTSDKYACIESIFDEDVNVLENQAQGGDHWEVETIVLTQDYEQIPSAHLENPEFPDPPVGNPIFEKGYVDFPMDDPDLWNIVDNKIRFYELTNPPDPSKPWSFEITTIWQSWVVFTECDNGTPTDPGGDWVLLDNCGLTSFSEEGFSKWRKPILSPTTIPPRGRRFEDVVQMLIEPCGLKLESYLFSAGGVGDKPDNSVYNWAEDNLSHLTFHQITDIVKKPINEVDFATRGDLNLSDLLDDLAALEIYWDIDENDNFILEHISYFLDESLMLDLTAEERKKYIQGKHKYKYVVDELPRIEEFEWKVQGEREFKRNILSTTTIPGVGRVGKNITVSYNELAFDAGKIVYDNACSDPEANTSYQFKTFVTNLADVLENPDNYPDELFVLVASNDQGEVITRDVYPGNNIIPTSYIERNRINAPLTLVELVYYLMRWNRPQKTGELVDANLTLNMTNSKRLREQEEITFPICCADLINTFDPADLVRTQLGWGEVADVNYSDPSGIMTIILRHR
jgi:hypothetical protein